MKRGSSWQPCCTAWGRRQRNWISHRNALDLRPRPGDTGLWTRQELTPGAFLYTCYGSDINRLSTETGCITVRRQAQGMVSIEGQLLRSEGSNAQCPID